MQSYLLELLLARGMSLSLDSASFTFGRVVGWDAIKREEDRGGATDLLLALLAMDIIMKEGLFPVAGRPCNIQHSYLR